MAMEITAERTMSSWHEIPLVIIFFVLSCCLGERNESSSNPSRSKKESASRYGTFLEMSSVASPSKMGVIDIGDDREVTFSKETWSPAEKFWFAKSTLPKSLSKDGSNPPARRIDSRRAGVHSMLSKCVEVDEFANFNNNLCNTKIFYFNKCHCQTTTYLKTKRDQP